MNKIAVDVVLIPPDDIRQFAIQINRGLSDTVSENHVLDEKTALPHITLLMGLVLRSQLPVLRQKLDVIAEKSPTLPLKITGSKILENSEGKTFCWLDIQKTPELQELHETILKELHNLFTYDDAQKEMFYSPPAVNEVPLFWREGFAKNSVGNDYTPHITLGWGKPLMTITPQPFIASRLALGHVGNHGTCRDILWSATLK